MRLDVTGEVTEPPHCPYFFRPWMNVESLAQHSLTILRLGPFRLQLNSGTITHLWSRRTEEQSAKRDSSTSHTLLPRSLQLAPARANSSRVILSEEKEFASK